MIKVSGNRTLLESRQRLFESIQDVNTLVKALKADDVEAAHNALGKLVRNSKGWQPAAGQLGMAEKDFKELASHLNQAKTASSTMKTVHLDAARELLGVTKGTPDPSLGRLASLTPAQVHGQPASQTQQDTPADVGARAAKADDLKLNQDERNIIKRIYGVSVSDLHNFVYDDLVETFDILRNNTDLHSMHSYESLVVKVTKQAQASPQYKDADFPDV